MFQPIKFIFKLTSIIKSVNIATTLKYVLNRLNLDLTIYTTRVAYHATPTNSDC